MSKNNNHVFSHFVIISVLCISHALAQQEILAITSYNLCVNVGPSDYLNCSDPTKPGGQGFNVTTLDLRLTASGTSSSTFVINLTTVPDEKNSDRKNTDPQRCNAPSSPLQNCIQTTPTNITIESTEYVYYYKLKRVSEIVPQYCYVGRFSSINTDEVSIYDSASTLNAPGTILCYQQDTVEYCGDETSQCGHIEEAFADIASIAMNNFTAAQKLGPYDPTYYKFTNADIKDTYSKPKRNRRGRFRDTRFSFDAVRKGRAPCRSTDDGAVPSQNDSILSRDDYEIASSYPISDPVPHGVKSKVNTAYGDVLQSTMCAGYECGGIYNAYAYPNFTDTYEISGCDALSVPVRQRFYAYNAKDGLKDTGKPPQSVGTVGMSLEIYSLGPECVLYELDEVPGVAVKIKIRAETLSNVDADSDGTVDTPDVNIHNKSTTQEVYITNLMGFQILNSTEQVMGARVVSVDTLDGYIGPTLGGYIVQCGDPNVDNGINPSPYDISDPRKNPLDDGGRTPDEGALDQLGLPFIDMRSYVFDDDLDNDGERDPEFDPTLNPWEIIMQNKTQPNGYYPTGEALDITPLPDKHRRKSMWYFIDIANEAWLGRGCNQLGMTDLFWNSNFEGGAPNSNTGLEQCYLSPFTCLPGHSEFSFGGRSIPGCLASATFKAKQSPGMNQHVNNAHEIDDILAKSLPPFYNPSNPNYWPTILPGGIGTVLMFDPSKNVHKQGQVMPELSFEILIDFVGSFVEYISDVPNGKIGIINCNGTEEVGIFNTANVSVINLGTKPGTYRVEIECPPSSGIIITPSTGDTPGSINPGETGYVYFNFDNSIDVDYLPTNASRCVMNLLPGGGDVFTILDTNTFTCDFVKANVTDGDGIIDGDQEGLNATLTCDCWDFQSFELDPDLTLWDSNCYVVPFIIGVICFIIFIIGIIVYAMTKYYTAKRQKESNAYLQIKIDKARQDMNKASVPDFGG